MLGIHVKDAQVIVIKVVVHVIVWGNKMGFRKPLDYTSVNHQIYMSGVEITNNRNDGFTQWMIKQDLYRLKWLLDEILEQSGTFSGEKEFIAEHSQHKMLNILKKDFS